jgi:hypothetical protein
MSLKSHRASARGDARIAMRRPRALPVRVRDVATSVGTEIRNAAGVSARFARSR